MPVFVTLTLRASSLRLLQRVEYITYQHPLKQQGLRLQMFRIVKALTLSLFDSRQAKRYTFRRKLAIKFGGIN